MRFFQNWFAAKDSTALRERRSRTRPRTRLRPGKLLGPDFAFLADCAILDRTESGVRIRCFAPIDPVDERVAVFDEKDGTVCSGRLVWQRSGEAGIRLGQPPARLDPKILTRLAAPYYAVTD